MRFTTKEFTTNWQALEIGIMMGCTISPLLFVMAMELVLKGASGYSEGMKIGRHLVLPPLRAFMDDITVIVETRREAKTLLARLDELFQQCRLRTKAKKSRSLSIMRGQVKELRFEIGGELITTIQEQAIKVLFTENDSPQIPQ